VSDLWAYVLDRLTKLNKDPRQVPDVEPARAAESAGGAATEEGPAAAEKPSAVVVELPTAQPNPPQPEADAERRNGADRRTGLRGALFSGPERRSNTFGRRHTDIELGNRK